MHKNVNDFDISGCQIIYNGIMSDGQAINGTIRGCRIRCRDYNIKLYSEDGATGNRAEGIKITSNYIDGWFGCKGIYLYNARDIVISNNVLDNYYDNPIYVGGTIGYGHIITSNVILVPNSGTTLISGTKSVSLLNDLAVAIDNGKAVSGIQVSAKSTDGTITVSQTVSTIVPVFM